MLARFASGCTFSEIAKENYVSFSSVQRTLNDAKKRMGAKTLVQLVLWAHHHGYISLPDEHGVVLAQSPFTEEPS